ncbi:MAG TPA: OmpH family outer membrane protein [Pyrinomonadaceae bacterium]|jgi:Skp family chaperone for outer membrane proteins|nr:OmpH family outer membrane protein [Pyrinomonadaceae bacterium]
MKRVSLFALGLIFAAVFAASASAQPGGVAAAVTPGKVVWLDSGAFGDDKNGIAKYVQAQKSIENEMTPRTTKLKGYQTQMQTLQTDIANLQKQAETNPAADKTALARQIQEKTDQGQSLQRQFEFEQKDAQAYYAKRAGEILSPISQQIMKSLSEYAKAKGFTVILDISVMAGDGQSPGSLLYLDPSADITKDFISYFNKSGAATATTTKP